jgi:hypothetical protein
VIQNIEVSPLPEAGGSEPKHKRLSPKREHQNWGLRRRKCFDKSEHGCITRVRLQIVEGDPVPMKASPRGLLRAVAPLSLWAPFLV